MNSGQNVDCGCEYGTVDEASRVHIQDNLKSGESLEEALKEVASRDLKSRTGHYGGCPVDVIEYEPEEFYCHSPRTWANSFLIPRSKGLLKIGPMKEDDPSYSRFEGESGIIGLYRKSDS